MADAKYERKRPPLSAEVRRSVEVESGHACAISRCDEHTYLEIHHINENREDNRVENLILLCDKHHKMAHAGAIDRKSLREYKSRLSNNYEADLKQRVAKLEQLLAQAPKPEDAAPTLALSATDADAGVPHKEVAPRAAVMAHTLEQLALAKYEHEIGLYLDRQPRISKGSARLNLDALRQDDDLPEDLVVEVRWLRRAYEDGPIWVRQIEAATSTYEAMTGRKAKGVLIYVVGRENMKPVSNLFFTSEEMQKLERKPEIIIYTYGDLGFDPGSISAAIYTSNIKGPGAAA
ncbi:HNH endonuclease signature motif containing protein [Paracidovorax avenae]|uniref:HNH endonuclease signature motif containing protein n=1 Tax=Paracidovorax avenae TaxID=80867 RepID=UPI001AD7F4DF|nr:HNH endonuclease signature motif containing protein [Paracidovorax avenae]